MNDFQAHVRFVLNSYEEIVARAAVVGRRLGLELTAAEINVILQDEGVECYGQQYVDGERYDFSFSVPWAMLEAAT